MPGPAIRGITRKMMFLHRLLIGLLCVLGAPSNGQCGGDPARPGLHPGYVHTDGKKFAGADGKPFLIKGISLGNWLVPEGYMFKFHHALSPHAIDAVFRHLIGDQETQKFWEHFRENYVTEADIHFLAQAGFTTIRIPLHWALFMQDTDTPKFAGPGDALLDQVIGWCRAAGLRVILDLHAAPGGQTGVNHDDGTGYPLTFYVPRFRRQTFALWSHLAARYANEPAVLGYDLLNEPISPYADEAFLNPRLEDFYKDIAAAIRTVDKNHILFIEGAQWSSNFSMFGPPFTQNIAYTYHMFWATPKRSSIARMIDFSNRYNVPLLLGETGELNDEWDENFRRLHEAEKIGWSFWTFKTMDSSTTVLSIPKIDGWEEIEKFGDTPPENWPAVTPELRARAQQALNTYLMDMRFDHTRKNACYLRALGLQAPGADSACPSHTAANVPYVAAVGWAAPQPTITPADP